MNVAIITFNDCDFSNSYPVNALDMTTPLVKVSTSGNSTTILPSLRMMVKTTGESATAFLDLSTQNGLVTYASSVITIHIPVALYGVMPAGEYVHSMIYFFPPLNTKTEIWRGTLTHTIGPTRWSTDELG